MCPVGEMWRLFLITCLTVLSQRDVLGLKKNIITLFGSLPLNITHSGQVAPARDKTGVTSTVHSNYLAAGRILIEYLQHNVMSFTSLFVISVCVQKFKNNGLLAHETEVNQLQAEGDRLGQTNHPGSPTIKVHLSAVSDFGMYDNCDKSL